LYLNGGGNLVFAVEHRGDELVVTEEESSDGLCEPGPCPVHSTELSRIPVPRGVTFEEVFHVVEGPGREYDEPCGG
jgi:hypothetical protein